MTHAQGGTYAVAMKRRIDLHGHRGARGLFPENTLVGFAGALAIGVDVLELDVAMTADDVVVVTHDPRLNPDITRTRTAPGSTAPGAAIRSLRAAELAGYDVGRIRPDSAYAASIRTRYRMTAPRSRRWPMCCASIRWCASTSN